MIEKRPGSERLNDTPTPLHRFIEQETFTEAAKKLVEAIDDPYGLVQLYATTEASLKQRQLSSDDIAKSKEKLIAFIAARQRASEKIHSETRRGEMRIPLGKVTDVTVLYTPGWSWVGTPNSRGKNPDRKSEPARFSVFASTEDGYMIPLGSLEATPVMVTNPESEEGRDERERDVIATISAQLETVQSAYDSYVHGKNLVVKSKGYANGYDLALTRGQLPTWKTLGELRRKRG